MKAVFLLPSDPYFPKPVLRALRESDSLARAGWEVSFVSWIRDEQLSKRPEDDPVPTLRIVRSVPPLGTSFVQRSRAYLKVTSLLGRAVEEEDPDLLVAHDLEVLWPAVHAKRAVRCPLIWDCHENWPALIGENNALEARVAAFQERRLTRQVDHILIPCEPVADKFRRWNRAITVLYNARRTEEINPSDRDAARQHFGYGMEDFVVGFAGVLGKGRRLPTLLEAISDLPPMVRALIVGGPNEEADRLRDLAGRLGISERVRIDGYRPFPELAPYYSAMDLAVILLDPLPNNLTATPNKLFDYMAHSVPVLAPDYLVLGPLLREHGCGWTLVDQGRSSVASAISAVRDSAQAPSRGARGRQAFLRAFCWDVQEARFLAIVRSVMRNEVPH